MKFSKFLLITFFVTFILLLLPGLLLSKEEYADKTHQDCKTCHVETGGALTDTGRAYAASGYTWPPEMGKRPILPLIKPIKVIVGFLHLFSAIAWFGTILYVHIILKPAYAAKGLPRGEVAVGFASMAVIFITGVLLTLSRVTSVSVLTSTIWGMLLLVKVSLFFIMVSTAFVAVLFIGPKLKSSMKKSAEFPKDGVFNTASLSVFDGKDGKPALIAFDDKVYDVSGSSRWEEGLHYKRHTAGVDLTDALKKAPHGAEKLEGFKVAGSFDTTLPVEKALEQKAFYLIAYLNLVLVFIITGVTAYWIWGI